MANGQRLAQTLGSPAGCRLHGPLRTARPAFTVGRNARKARWRHPGRRPVTGPSGRRRKAPWAWAPSGSVTEIQTDALSVPVWAVATDNLTGEAATSGLGGGPPASPQFPHFSAGVE